MAGRGGEASAGSPPDSAALLGRMTDAFFAVDGEWRFTYLNERADEIMRAATARDLPESLVGEEFWESIPEATDTVFYEQYHEAMATGEAVAFEEYYPPLDVWFEVRAYPDDEGLSVFFRDVSERRRIETELRRNEQTLRELYEVSTNQDLDFETKVGRLLGVGCEHLDLPIGFLTRIDEHVQRIVAAHGDHSEIQAGGSCPLEESYCRRTVEADGLVGVLDAPGEWGDDDPGVQRFGLGAYVGAKVVVDGDLYGTVCFAATESREREFSDSEQRLVELLSKWVGYELGQKRSREELARRNERLERFASVLSHDLRNPLNVAAGNVELARETCEAPELDTAADAIDRMADIIEDVLTLAREGETVTEVEEVDLAAVAAEAWRSVETETATIDTDPAEGAVAADAERLQRALENLFRNSVEHGGEEVTVTVGTTPDGFYVADDGPGIPDEEREDVFDHGHTTAENGTGFGLTIVREIAAAHGWSVTAEESDAGGTRFAFRT